MAATVRVTVEDKVGTLALDNVTKRNALGVGTVEELLRALAACSLLMDLTVCRFVNCWDAAGEPKLAAARRRTKAEINLSIERPAKAENICLRTERKHTSVPVSSISHPFGRSSFKPKQP